MVDIPDLWPVFDGGRAIRYKKGEYLIRSDDEPQGVYFVENGYIEAFSTNHRGDTYVHMIFAGGEIFPLVWGLGRTYRSGHVNFRAFSTVTVIRLARETFLERITSSPSSNAIFLEYITYALTTYADRVQNLQYRYASERVAYRLLFLATRFAVKEGRGLQIILPLTHEDIASSINLSPKSVARELKRLSFKKLIHIDQQRIVLLDIKKLGEELKTDSNEHIFELLSKV